MRTLLAVVALLVMPAAASADLPRFSSSRITPGTAAGGAKVGMAADTAIAKWGGNPDCPKPFTGLVCTWRSDGGATAVLYFKSGKVRSLDLRVGTTSSGEPRFTGPLMKLKTRKHIGLGSTIRAIVKAYPKVKGSGSGPQLGAPPHTTIFSTSGGRTAELFIGAEL